MGRSAKLLSQYIISELMLNFDESIERRTITFIGYNEAKGKLLIAYGFFRQFDARLTVDNGKVLGMCEQFLIQKPILDRMPFLQCQ